MEKPWRVLEVRDLGRGVDFRYYVQGVNLNYPADHVNYRFHWNVKSLDDPQYDLTHASYGRDSYKEAVIARICKAVNTFAKNEGLFPAHAGDCFCAERCANASWLGNFNFEETILAAVEKRLTGTLTMQARVTYTPDAWSGKGGDSVEKNLTEVHLNYPSPVSQPQTAFESNFDAAGHTVYTKWIAEMKITPTIS